MRNAVAYLGEKVVSEKEYRSAIASYSGAVLEGKQVCFSLSTSYRSV
jgi:hypothetical protein